MSEWGLRIERDAKNIKKLLPKFLTSISNCVDVGAHTGSFLNKFVMNAPKGKHYAFEPLPALAERLSKNFPDVEVFNCALSDHTGRAFFYHVPELPAWSGLQKQPYPIDTKPIKIQVEVKCLDDVIGIETMIDIIKIDVEGAELDVLKGAASTIKRCHPLIIFECAKIHNTNYSITPDQVYDFLVDKCGLQIWDLGLSEMFTRKNFCKIYEISAASNYGREAQTNFVAR